METFPGGLEYGGHHRALYWAEHGGILGMWKALHAIRSGQMERTLESKHKDLSIDEIVQRTWQPKEKVPAVAAPRMGGTLVFWREALASLQSILDQFGEALKPEELRVAAHPHPISGPLVFINDWSFWLFTLDVTKVKHLLCWMRKEPKKF